MRSRALAWILIGAVVALVALFSLLHRAPSPLPTLAASVVQQEPPADPSADTLELAPAPDLEREMAADTPAHSTPGEEAHILALRVRGQCLDAQGLPLSGVDVRCASYTCAASLVSLGDGSRPPKHFAPTKTPHALSDSRGEFELDATPGADRESTCYRLELEFSAPGRPVANASVDVLETRLGDAGVIVLPRSANITGRVFDSAGTPIPQAMVRVHLTSDRGSVYGSQSATTAADGRYAIEGVAPGKLELKARAMDHRESPRLLLDLTEGEAKDAVDLVLPVFQDPNAISGVVLSSAGEPVSKARLSFSWKVNGHDGRVTCIADSSGAFRQALSDLASVRLHAEDPQEHSGSVTLEDVALGTHGMHVMLGEPQFLNVRAVDAAGAPVLKFGWGLRIQRTSSAWDAASASEGQHEQGRARILANSDPFFVQLHATGFRGLELGPFHSADLPAEVLFRLENAAGIRGTVLSNRRALAGASVELWTALEAGEEAKIGRLPVRMKPCRGGPVRGTSAADGSFLLSVEEPGHYHVIASAAEHAPVVTPVLDYTLDQGVAGLVLALGQGGTLEGRVFDADGLALGARWIAANSGDPPVSYAKSGADGAFRFEHLAPGAYAVRLLERQPEPNNRDATWSRPEGGQRTVFAADCEVREGQVTHFDLRALPSARLVLQLARELSAMAEWHATAIVEAEGESIYVEATWNAARDEARFELARVGACTVQLGARVKNAFYSLDSTFDLAAGPSERRLEFASGRVRGVAAPVEGRPAVVLIYSRTSDRWHFTGRVSADAQGRFELPCVPVGRGNLLFPGSQAPAREFEVVAGETLVLEGK